ncbi:MAG: hypothetical protein WBY94_12665, partial [Polyangiaceae bacterium]
NDGARTIYAAARQLIYTAIGLFAAVEALDSWRRREMELAHGLGGVAIAAALLLVASSVFARPTGRR